MKTLGVADNALRKNDLRFRVQQQQQNEGQEEEEDFEDFSELDEREIEKLNRQLEQASRDILGEEASEQSSRLQEEETNYYKENIFNREDYYLYRAVMYFYAGDYERAISDFEQSSNIMHAQKVLYPRNQFSDGGENSD